LIQIVSIGVLRRDERSDIRAGRVPRHDDDTAGTSCCAATAAALHLDAMRLRNGRHAFGKTRRHTAGTKSSPKRPIAGKMIRDEVP
jgi:hypothetical protein